MKRVENQNLAFESFSMRMQSLGVLGRNTPVMLCDSGNVVSFRKCANRFARWEGADRNEIGVGPCEKCQVPAFPIFPDSTCRNRAGRKRVRTRGIAQYGDHPPSAV